MGVCGGEETYLKPYQFKMEELDGFRYRARDAWRSVTKIAVREARLKEIKKELLRYDKALHTVKHQEHLKNIPEYIVPETLKRITGIKSNKRRKNKRGGGGRITDTQ